MKANYALLAAANLTLMAVTAVVGLIVDGRDGFARHFLLGVMTGLFTCFVHVVLFMYFVVQEKIVTQSILQHDLDAVYSAKVQGMKSRALHLSAIGIFAVLLASGLGAAIGIYVGSTPHLFAAFACMFVNAVLFVFQYALIVEYGDMFRTAFNE